MRAGMIAPARASSNHWVCSRLGIHHTGTDKKAHKLKQNLYDTVNSFAPICFPLSSSSSPPPSSSSPPRPLMCGAVSSPWSLAPSPTPTASRSPRRTRTSTGRRWKSRRAARDRGRRREEEPAARCTGVWPALVARRVEPRARCMSRGRARCT